MILGDKEITALNDVSSKLGIYNPEWLHDLIFFESAGTNSPTIKNPLSSARGLIQFMDATAKGMGYADSLALVNKFSSYESQLRGPVYNFLKPYAPFDKEYKLYMAVFFPAAIHYPEDMTFYDIFKHVYPTDYERRYALFIKQNPGILTPGHYVAKVKKKPLRVWGTIGLSLAALIGISYYLLKK